MTRSQLTAILELLSIALLVALIGFVTAMEVRGAEPTSPQKPNCSRITIPDDRVACRWNEFAERTRQWQRQFARLRPNGPTLEANPEQAALAEQTTFDAMLAALAVVRAERLSWAQHREKPQR
jgi:hypothetical protein